MMGTASMSADNLLDSLASKKAEIERSEAAAHRLTIGGYGEAVASRMFYSNNYKRYTSADLYKDDKGFGQFDLPHVVIYLGYDFGKGWSMGTEIEFEHGGTESAIEIEEEETGEYESEVERGGEVALEQFWLQKSQLDNILANNTLIKALDEDGAAADAFATLGYGLLGFHAVEYVLFRDGAPRNVNEIGEAELIYNAAVAQDLANQTIRLEASWAGMDDITAAKRSILEEFELEPSFDYGENMVNAGMAGNTLYKTQLAAMEQILTGASDISDEVGNTKITDPVNSGNVLDVESWYSWNSIADFTDNIRSVRNAYYGSLDGTVNNNSMAAYINKVNSTLDHNVRSAIDSLQSIDDQATIRALGEADERYQIANMVAAGTMIKLFPLNHKGSLEWYSHGSLDVPHDIDDGKWLFMRSGMDYLYEKVASQDWNGASQFIAKLKKYQVKECGNSLPSTTRFKSEKLYNSINWERPLAMALATLGILLFAITCRCIARTRQLPRWANLTTTAVLALALIYLTIALALRWIISGHVPMSNGFETMQFMSWATILISLLLARRSMLVLPFGILTAGLALMVASFGESNPQITQLMPVLASPLLSTHVAVIMIAYSLLAFLMLGGVMALILRRDHAVGQRLHIIGQIILYPAVFLLTIGVFIGAIWANVSWGSYWSWDPKEVWALITLIIYALPLHGQSLPMFRKPQFFHGYCVIAFLSVLITYFGVNFILGGLHSYA